jgi:thiol-disulfide isomerase/thioredoxin
MYFYLFTILSVYLINSGSVNGQKPKEEVTEWATHLNDSSFNEFIQSNKLVLVMFHQPFCIHCVKLLPVIKEAAKILTKKPTLTEVPAKIVIVDISKSPQLVNIFQINSTPQLKFFRDNHVYEYEGPRDNAKCRWRATKSFQKLIKKLFII